MPNKFMTSWLTRLSYRDFVYAFVVLIIGFLFWVIEWGLDSWEELPAYVVSGLVLYVLGRISYFSLEKNEFIPAAGAVIFGFLFGLFNWGFDLEELATFGIGGLLIYLVLRFFYYVMGLGLDSVKEVPPIAQAENEIVIYLVQSLRKRAIRLKLSGRFVLLSILIAIVGGIQVFYTADVVARANSGEYQLAKFVYDLERVVQGRSRFTRFETPRWDNIIAETKEGVEIDWNKFLSEVKNIVKVETDRFIKISEPDPQEIIISTLTTRIGTIFLLLFLVQILVSLYRYSIKLAAFYDGRADLLQLLPNSEKLDIEKLVTLTTTDGLDFSKQEKAPADYAIELAKKIIDKSEK